MRFVAATLLFGLLGTTAKASLIHRYSLVSCADVEAAVTPASVWGCNVVDGTRSLSAIAVPLVHQVNDTASASTELTISLWATIPTDSKSQELVHIPNTESECPLFGVSYEQSQIVVEFIDRYGVCRHVGINLLQSRIVYLVVSFGEKSMSIFLNGGDAQVWDAPQSIHSELWKRASTLHLFSDQQGALLQDVIPIQQVELYDREMTSTQALELWNRGVVYPSKAHLEFPSSALENVILAQKNETQSTAFEETLPDNTLTHPTMIEIVAIPRVGTLTASLREGGELTEGLHLPWARQVTFSYSVPPNYFNVPTRNARGLVLQHEPETILSYRLVVHLTNETMVVSDVVSVNFRVVHTNHPPELVVPTQVILKENEMAPIDGITVLDSRDWNMDRVRVRASVTAGHLLLPSGEPSREVEIIAAPDDVAWELHGLRYHGTDVGTEGELKVEVHDGVGGPCLDSEDHEAFSRALGNEYATNHHGVCYTRTGTISLIVVGRKTTAARIWRALIWLLATFLLLFCIGCCGVLFHCWPVDNVSSDKTISDEEDRRLNIMCGSSM